MSSDDLSDLIEPASASGARLTGDDLQHLIGWYHGLRMLRPENEIESVAFEARASGNLDDVVITYATNRTEYMQVKAVVSADRGLNTAWLLAPGRNGGRSILSRFWASWRKIRERSRDAELRLITNRSIDPKDPVFKLRDRKNLLTSRLRRASRHTAAGRARARWVQHLKITNGELYELLDVLHFDTDASEASWRQHVTDVAQGLGLRADEASLLAGVGQVREWIKDSGKARTVRDVEEAIKRLGLRREEPYSVLVVQALERVEVPDTVEALDWVDRFVGNSPRTRRGLRRPGDWNTVLLPELDAACRRASERNRRVMVQGAMRLPARFAIGAYLSDVAGACPATTQGGEVWSAADLGGAPRPQVVVMDERVVGKGTDLALTIAVSTNIAPDVIAFLRGSKAVGTHLTIALSPGPDRQAVGSSAEAAAAALAIRDMVREMVRVRGVKKIHLFLAMPGGLALLLGHFWDRMPPTQTYEDLVTNGYEAAFLIANTPSPRGAAAEPGSSTRTTAAHLARGSAEALPPKSRSGTQW